MKTFATRVVIVAGIVAAIAALAAFFVLALNVLLLVFAGLLLAVLLGAAADFISRVLGTGRGAGLAIALVLIVATVAVASVALWPSVSEQIDDLARQLPAAVDEMRGWAEQREWSRWIVGRAESSRTVQGGTFVDDATGALMTVAGAMAALVVIVFVGVYVAAQPTLYHKGIRRLVPVRRRERFDDVVFEVTSVLRWWLVGKLLSMVIVGVLTTGGLLLLGVPLALTFGLLAAALTFIPNFGPVLALIPPAVLTLAEDPRQTLYVVVLYFAIQIVESYAITPLIQRRTVAMPPALTIGAQMVLGVFVGAVGVAVATPLTAAAITVTRMLYVEGLLERGSAITRTCEDR